MQIMILVNADVKMEPEDDIKSIKRELDKEISANISRFAGNKVTQKNMYPWLRNVDHETFFLDEGELNIKWTSNGGQQNGI